jgi:predicted nucleic-acid-binding protein
MKALDTNVLARFFIEDPDDAQAHKQRPAAMAAMGQRAYISITVVLEFEWLMRGFYKLSVPQTTSVLRALLSIEHITVEARLELEQAVQAAEAGMDFAAALHVLRSGRATGFLTFDQALVKRAAQTGLRPTAELLV